MALPVIFANLPAGTTAASTLDQNFAALGAIDTIPCTASTGNAITLAPAANTPSVSAYNQLQAFRFVCGASTTGTVTVGLASPGLLPAYKPSSGGPTAAGSGDLVIGESYDAVYDVALNSGSGGFHIYNVIPASSAGAVIQVVNTLLQTVATGTTVIPLDNTKPQNTEGNQYMTLAITPTNSSHKLEIDVTVVATHSTAGAVMIVALFQDSTVDALAAVAVGGGASGTDTRTITFKYYMTAGTTSATTFKVRVGGSGAGTTTINGIGGTQIFGGVCTSSITITETT